MRLRPLSAALSLALLMSGCTATTSEVSIVAIEPAAATTPTPEPTPVPMTRDEAVTAFSAESFLPPKVATCVVDTVHGATGLWNPSHPQAMESTDTAEIIETCSHPEPRPTPQGITVTRSSGPPMELTDETMPAFSAGQVTRGNVALTNATIDYVVVTPNGFEIGDTAPVFLAFPPGAQGIDIAEAVMNQVYANQAVAKGWVVISPAAPDGVRYFTGSEQHVPELMRWINAWVTPEGGKLHLGGMSAGGTSAFVIAEENPGYFHSLLAYPGVPWQPTQADYQNLAQIPVRMWVGELDDGMAPEMEKVAAGIRSYNGDVILNVLPGEPHVLVSTQDGQAFFRELEAARVG